MGLLRAVWKAISYYPPVWVLVLQSMLFWPVQPAFGHSDAITKCEQNIKYQKAVKVGVDAIIESTGLYAEHYDTNGDGQFDVVAFSQTDLSDKYHRVNPLFWIVDVDRDGTPDAIYIDKFGNGRCEDIVLYEDLRAPKSNFDTPDNIDKGRKM